MKRSSHFRSLLFLPAIISLALVPGLSAQARTVWERTQPPRLGREFDLRVGERVILRKTRLSLRFLPDREDSRCPSDVTCVWAGNARVQLLVTSGRIAKTITLNSNISAPSPADGSFADYTVKLVDLSPYPLSKRPIAPGDYVVRLVVTQN